MGSALGFQQVAASARQRARQQGAAARLAARSASITHTSGLAPGNAQANLMILPRELAFDFLLFCQRNPKPCPLLHVADAGDPHLTPLGDGLDVRTDALRYRVWREGEMIEETSDIRAHWRDDLVSFAIGCSFSFEEALIEAGIELRNVSCGTNVSMFRTNVACTPAGVFSGPLVVTMRPMPVPDVIRAVQITSRFPSVHGAPVHFGDPAAIGITDLSKPDYGDPVPIHPGEVPVFWACGVTPQAVVAAAKPSFCITHAPGAMLVTDVLNAELAA